MPRCLCWPLVRTVGAGFPCGRRESRFAVQSLSGSPAFFYYPNEIVRRKELNGRRTLVLLRTLSRRCRSSIGGASTAGISGGPVQSGAVVPIVSSRPGQSLPGAQHANVGDAIPV